MKCKAPADVDVEFVITTKGKVCGRTVVSELSPECAHYGKAALDVVKRWRYEPARGWQAGSHEVSPEAEVALAAMGYGKVPAELPATRIRSVDLGVPPQPGRRTGHSSTATGHADSTAIAACRHGLAMTRSGTSSCDAVVTKRSSEEPVRRPSREPGRARSGACGSRQHPRGAR